MAAHLVIEHERLVCKFDFMYVDVLLWCAGSSRPRSYSIK